MPGSADSYNVPRMPIHNEIPVLGITAFSGVGKTTLLRKLIPALSDRGVRVGVVKHTHHDFDIDVPGKDSYDLRKAGAMQTLVASDTRRVFITETPNSPAPRLMELLEQFDPRRVDLILVEGFRREPIPRIELHRPQLRHPLLCVDDDSVIALATDEPITVRVAIPTLDLNLPDQIAEFIVRWGLSLSAARAQAEA
jgi:molybdopterin-guanine dinucleotide biosynthesis protein B